MSDNLERSSNDTTASLERDKFLIDLKLLDVDYLICLRFCMKFEENTLVPYTHVINTAESSNIDDDNFVMSEVD